MVSCGIGGRRRVVGLGAARRPARWELRRWPVGRRDGWTCSSGDGWSAVASVVSTVAGRVGSRSGASWTGPPAVASWASGRLDVFVKGARWSAVASLGTREGGRVGSRSAAGSMGRRRWPVGRRAGWTCSSRGPMVSCGIVGSRAGGRGLGAARRPAGWGAGGGQLGVGPVGRVRQGGWMVSCGIVGSRAGGRVGSRSGAARWGSGGGQLGAGTVGRVRQGDRWSAVASLVRGRVVGLGATRWVARRHAVVRRGPAGRTEPADSGSLPADGPGAALPFRRSCQASTRSISSRRAAIDRDEEVHGGGVFAGPRHGGGTVDLLVTVDHHAT